jgi:hypothetical protein
MASCVTISFSRENFLSGQIVIYPSIYGSAVLLLQRDCFIGFLILYTVSRTPRTGDQPVSRPLPTHRTTQTQNKSTQTSMSRVGFKSTTPAFKWAKRVHALHVTATVIDRTKCEPINILFGGPLSRIRYWYISIVLDPSLQTPPKYEIRVVSELNHADVKTFSQHYALIMCVCVKTM